MENVPKGEGSSLFLERDDPSPFGTFSLDISPQYKKRDDPFSLGDIFLGYLASIFQGVLQDVIQEGRGLIV